MSLIKNSLLQHRGFTLLEVLITLVILAIGLLGLAGLQATGLNNNHSAYNRSQATQLTYDLTDRMRTNISNINDYVIADSHTASAAHSACLTSAGCSPSNMAKRDLYEWNLALVNALPKGIGSVSTSGALFTISINWDDNRDGNVDANDPNFQLSLQP